MEDEKLEVMNAQMQGVTKSAEKFRGELGKLIEMCKEVQKLEFVPKEIIRDGSTGCYCRKCGEVVSCEHNDNEPCITSICGNCAGK